MARREPRAAAGGPVADPPWAPTVGEVPGALLGSAVRCFAEHGFHATTTRDISGGAGLSPAAMYVHFPSKEHVLFEIARRGHEDALAVVEAPDLAGETDAAARLRTMVVRFVAWHARHHVTARVCQYELAALTDEHYDEIRAIRRRFRDVFREAVTRATDPALADAAEVNRVVRGVFSLGIDLVRWYRPDGADSPEQLGEFYGDLVLRMLAR